MPAPMSFLQAIDEMVEYYRNESQLAQRLLWMKVFLERTDTVTKADKKEVEKRLDTLEQLLEESEYIQRQRAIGWKKGVEEGKAVGKLQALRQAMVNVVNARFPELAELAQRQVERVSDISILQTAITLIAKETDPQIVENQLNLLDNHNANGHK